MPVQVPVAIKPTFVQVASDADVGVLLVQLTGFPAGTIGYQDVSDPYQKYPLGTQLFAKNGGGASTNEYVVTSDVSGSGKVAVRIYSSGIGGTTSGLTTVDFGLIDTNNTSRSITGQSLILSTSTPFAFLVAQATADHTVDEHLIAPIQLVCSPATAGVGFTIYATSDWLLRGAFTVRWGWM